MGGSRIQARSSKPISLTATDSIDRPPRRNAQRALVGQHLGIAVQRRLTGAAPALDERLRVVRVARLAQHARRQRTLEPAQVVERGGARQQIPVRLRRQRQARSRSHPKFSSVSSAK
jgi:hypothetical protein